MYTLNMKALKIPNAVFVHGILTSGDDGGKHEEEDGSVAQDE